MSKSLSKLTNEVSLFRKQKGLPIEKVMSSPGSPLNNDTQFLEPNLLKAIETVIIRIVPGIITAQLQNLSLNTS